MKKFRDYHVTLHNPQKHSKVAIIKKCVSKSAACNTATVLERINNRLSTFRGTMAYELDASGKPIW